MPAGPRIRGNNSFGVTTDNPLTIGATTFNSAGLATLPAVSSAHAVVVLDPKRVNGEPEIVVVTTHTAAATVATITRGQYGTAARAHPQNTAWAHVPVDEDYIEILTSSTRPSNPYEGQFIYETDTDVLRRYTGAAWNTTYLDPPAVRVRRNVATSFNSGVGQIISFTNAYYDTAGMWSAGAPTLITIPITGVYVLSLDIAFAARNDYEMVFASIQRSDGVYLAIQTARNNAIVGSNDAHMNVSTTIGLTAGQAVRADVFQRNTAAAAANLISTTHYSPELSATWIGRG